MKCVIVNNETVDNQHHFDGTKEDISDHQLPFSQQEIGYVIIVEVMKEDFDGGISLYETLLINAHEPNRWNDSERFNNFIEKRIHSIIYKRYIKTGLQEQIGLSYLTYRGYFQIGNFKKVIKSFRYKTINNDENYIVVYKFNIRNYMSYFLSDFIFDIDGLKDEQSAYMVADLIKKKFPYVSRIYISSSGKGLHIYTDLKSQFKITGKRFDNDNLSNDNKGKDNKVSSDNQKKRKSKEKGKSKNPNKDNKKFVVDKFSKNFTLYFDKYIMLEYQLREIVEHIKNNIGIKMKLDASFRRNVLQKLWKEEVYHHHKNGESILYYKSKKNRFDLKEIPSLSVDYLEEVGLLSSDKRYLIKRKAFKKDGKKKYKKTIKKADFTKFKNELNVILSRNGNVNKEELEKLLLLLPVTLTEKRRNKIIDSILTQKLIKNISTVARRFIYYRRCKTGERYTIQNMMAIFTALTYIDTGLSFSKLKFITLSVYNTLSEIYVNKDKFDEVKTALDECYIHREYSEGDEFLMLPLKSAFDNLNKFTKSEIFSIIITLNLFTKNELFEIFDNIKYIGKKDKEEIAKLLKEIEEKTGVDLQNCYFMFLNASIVKENTLQYIIDRLDIDYIGHFRYKDYYIVCVNSKINKNLYDTHSHIYDEYDIFLYSLVYYKKNVWNKN